MLAKTQLSKNESILITGSSGGVGSACVQLAKMRGAAITAITSQSKIENIKNLGANNVITYNQLEHIDNQSIDVVIDLVGGSYSNELINKLKNFGRYATAGAVSGPIASIDIRTIYLQNLSLFGTTVLNEKIFKNLISYIEKKKIIPLIAKTFTLNKIIEAQKFFLMKKYTGKIVITVY